MSYVPKNSEQWEVRDPEDHFVYIMAHLNADFSIIAPVKIGISKNPDIRLKQVQATVSGRIVLMARFAFWRRDHALMVEKAFHRTCQEYCVSGEWFDIAPADAVALMAENLKGFAENFLGCPEPQDYFTAYGHIGVPGFDQLFTAKDFGHEQ